MAICRAGYHNPDILLLDDAFSSLDVHVSQRIFTNLIENLLLPRGKTVVFATSSHAFVRPSSNVVIVTETHQVVTSPEEVNRYLVKLENEEKFEEEKEQDFLNGLENFTLQLKKKASEREVNDQEKIKFGYLFSEII